MTQPSALCRAHYKGTTSTVGAITYMLLCGYTLFRPDDMKEVIRQTTEARTKLHDRYWKNVSDEGTPRIIDKLALHSFKSAYLTLDSGTQQ